MILKLWKEITQSLYYVPFPLLSQSLDVKKMSTLFLTSLLLARLKAMLKNKLNQCHRKGRANSR